MADLYIFFTFLHSTSLFDFSSCDEIILFYQWQASVIIMLWKQTAEESEMDKEGKMLWVLDCCQQLTVSPHFYHKKIKIMLSKSSPVYHSRSLNKCANFNFSWGCKSEMLLCFYLVPAEKQNKDESLLHYIFFVTLCICL